MLLVKIYLHKLDSKLIEVAERLLLRHQNIKVVTSIADADAILYQILDHELIQIKDKLHVVLDMTDGFPTWGPSLGREIMFDEFFPKTSPEIDYIIFKLQMYNLSPYKHAPEHIHLISVPLLLGGSNDKWVHDLDFREDSDKYLFSKNLKPNPKNYQYNVAIVNNSNPNRNNVFAIASRLENSKIINTFDNRMDLDSTIEIHRKSKINLSLNGQGYWCLKDGELFSRNCFNMRHSRPMININPLSPQNGRDWIVFEESNCLELIDYYLKNEKERERINDTGHYYFAYCISYLYSKEYGDRIIRFLASNNEKDLQPFAIRYL